MKGSWKTTLLGVATVVGAISAAATAFLDGNDATNVNWEVTITAITAGLGLIFARDNDVSSEDAGAK